MTQFLVIPAKAGTHAVTAVRGASVQAWVPAFAGMTKSYEIVK